VPLRLTDWGEPLALSVMLMAADFAPVETGLKVTETVQLAPAAREPPQVFVNEKSSACPPPSVIELIASALTPELVTVTVFDPEVPSTFSLPNANDVALNLTAGAEPAATPVPLKLTIWGEPPAVSVIWMAAVLVPVATGLKAIATVQLAPAASDEPQEFFNVKSSAWLPVKDTDVRVALPLPVLRTVTC
jgi:hypothetical protein